MAPDMAQDQIRWGVLRKGEPALAALAHQVKERFSLVAVRHGRVWLQRALAPGMGAGQQKGHPGRNE